MLIPDSVSILQTPTPLEYMLTTGLIASLPRIRTGNLQHKYVVLAVTTCAFISVGLAWVSYPPISNLVSIELHLSYVESGWITSTFGLAYALTQIPGGMLADRLGGTKALLFSLVAIGLAQLLSVAGGTLTAVLISRAIAGAGCGIVVPSSIRLLSSWFSKKELDWAMGVFGSGWGVSLIISYTTLPPLATGGSWRAPLLFTAALSLAVASVAVLPARWSLGAESLRSSAPGVAIRDLLSRKLFILTLPNFAALGVLVGVLAWTPAFLTSTLHLSEVSAGRVVAIVGAMNILASFAGGLGAQRLGKRRVIALSMLLSLVFPILLGTASSWTAALLWVCGIGFATMLYFGPLFSLVPYVSRQGPEVAGAAFGVFNTLSNIATFLSPILMGYILDSTGSFMLAFAALGMIAIYGLVGVVVLPDE